MTDGGAGAPIDLRISSTRATNGGTVDANLWFKAANTTPVGFAIEGIDAANYSNLTLDFYYRRESGATVVPTLAVEFWNGTAWQTVSGVPALNATPATWTEITNVALPAAAQINGLKIRFVKSGTEAFRLDEVKLNGTSTVVAPTIASTLNARANIFTTIEESFNVTTTTGNNANQLVKVKMALTNPAQRNDIALTYAATAGNFLPLTFDANGELMFGPATGFPLADATTAFKINFSAAGTYAYTLAIVDATTNANLATPVFESVTVAAFVNPTISSTLNGRSSVTTGVQETYDVTTNAGNMAGRTVKVKATLANPAQAANMALEYLETSNNQWYPLTFDANGVLLFGPATGFPLANATSNFRVTYNAVGTYATTLEIIDAATGVPVVAGVSESVTVSAPVVAPTISSTLNNRTNVKTTLEESFAVSTTTGTNANQMVKVKMVLATPAQATDINLFYEATAGNFLPITFNAAGEFEFGPATGFPLANTSTNFKITFNTAGTYNYSLSIIDAATGTALAAPAAESVTVAAFVNGTIVSTLNARANVVTGAEQSFAVTTAAGDDNNKVVKIKIALTNPAQAADLALSYEATTGNFQPLTFDAAGEIFFGPSTGFPLANATTNFKAIFSAVGTYGYTLSIIDAATGTVIGTPATESVTILVNGVREDALANLINVYPNPVAENLNIDLGNITKADISVLDLTGKVVSFSKQVSGAANLNVANLKPGTYMLRIKTSEGVATKRFVVVR
jgi:hypothetical protein